MAERLPPTLKGMVKGATRGAATMLVAGQMIDPSSSGSWAKVGGHAFTGAMIGAGTALAVGRKAHMQDGADQARR